MDVERKKGITDDWWVLCNEKALTIDWWAEFLSLAQAYLHVEPNGSLTGYSMSATGMQTCLKYVGSEPQTVKSST